MTPNIDNLTAEQRFLNDYDANVFPHPSLAVDVVLLTVLDGDLQVALVQRSEHPAKHQWALPGGFVAINESLDAAASRVLADKADQQGIFLEQLYTFGAPDRDPRTRVVSVAYYALIEAGRFVRNRPASMTNRRIKVPWQGERGGPVVVIDENGEALPLSFDHALIIGTAIKRIRGKLNYAPIGYQLLPDTFTLRRLQDIHEAVLGSITNKDSFRRRMLASGDIEATGKRESDVGHRPAELYRFTAGHGV